MPTVQTGARGTIDLLDVSIVRDVLQEISLLDPEAHPLTTLLSALMKSEPADNPEPIHIEDELVPNITLVSGAQTAADTSLEVDNPEFIIAGDVLHFPRTGENMVATTAPGANPITVARGVGSAPPAALVDDDECWILGGVSREGDVSRTAINTMAIPVTTYLQIVRNSIEATGTQLATKQYHGSDFEYQRRKALIQHKRQLEYLFKFGQQSRVSVSGEWRRTMPGLFETIRTNRLAVNGILDEGTFDAFCEMLFDHGSTRKCLLAPAKVRRAINNFAKNRMVTVPGDESYGLNLRRYEADGGYLDILADRELKGSIYGGCAIGLDLDQLVIRYLRAGPESRKAGAYQGMLMAKLIEDVQPPNSDTKLDEFFSELALQNLNERTHAIMTGVEG